MIDSGLDVKQQLSERDRFLRESRRSGATIQLRQHPTLTEREVMERRQQAQLVLAERREHAKSANGRLEQAAHEAAPSRPLDLGDPMTHLRIVRLSVVMTIGLLGLLVYLRYRRRHA